MFIKKFKKNPAREFLFLIVALLLIGSLLPKLVAKFQTSKFKGDEQIFAQYALQEARSFIGGSSEPFFVTRFKVFTVEIDRQAEEKSKEAALTATFNHQDGEKAKSVVYQRDCKEIVLGGNKMPIKLDAAYKAKVRLYTYFGIPYTTIEIYCLGAARI